MEEPLLATAVSQPMEEPLQAMAVRAIAVKAMALEATRPSVAMAHTVDRASVEDLDMELWTPTEHPVTTADAATEAQATVATEATVDTEHTSLETPQEIS